MALTSLNYLMMVLVAAVLYYLLPISVRWVAVLIANGYFLYSCNTYVQLLEWIVVSLVAFFVPILVSRINSTLAKRIITYIGLSSLLGTMIALRQLNLAPLGASYYSLIYIAYMLDTYYGMCKVEKNIFKFFAFAGYFPILTSGPLIKYGEIGESITHGNRFEFKNLVFGLERILWGYVKKLIIADRISLFVGNVYNLPYVYNGLYIWIATAFFIIQLYMDFSGCVDIALGTAEIFGVRLPENFDFPFLAETIEEFWRKWHITLGGFLRDYAFYPILKSVPFQKLQKWTKRVFGKKYGKKIPTWMALMIVWTMIGFWHGKQANYIFGVGIWFGFIIIVSDAMTPVFEKLNRVLRINTYAFSWKLFRIVRTWFLFGFGLLFFRAQGFMRALLLLKLSVSTFNPWILFDGSIYYPGLDVTDFHILTCFIALVSITSVIAYVKKKSIREMFANQNLLFQWVVIIALLLSVITYGCYGVGFDSASFIYQGF